MNSLPDLLCHTPFHPVAVLSLKVKLMSSCRSAWYSAWHVVGVFLEGGGGGEALYPWWALSVTEES